MKNNDEIKLKTNHYHAIFPYIAPFMTLQQTIRN